MDFSNGLKTYRKRKGMSQAQLSEALGVDRTTLTKWETGENIPSIEVLDKLASLLDISTDDLLGRAPIIDKYKRDECNVRLLAQYSKLNDIGKREAVKRVSELCMIPKYTAKEAVNNMPIAAHSDAKITDKELELMRQDIDEL